MRLKTVAFVLTAVFAIAAVTMVPSFAQQAQNGTTNDDTLALPISSILDSAINAHEQDIKDNIFEYKFNSANDSPDVQAYLIIARSDELKKDAADNEDLMKALIAKNASISGEQLAAIAQETNKSMEKLTGRSKKLEKRAGEVYLREGSHSSYVDPVKPLMSNITSTQTLVTKISRTAKDKMALNNKIMGNKNTYSNKYSYGKR